MRTNAGLTRATAASTSGRTLSKLPGDGAAMMPGEKARNVSKPACLAGLLTFLAFSPGIIAAPSPGNFDKVRPEVDAAVARVKPALVRIRVVSTSYSEGREI